MSKNPINTSEKEEKSLVIQKIINQEKKILLAEDVSFSDTWQIYAVDRKNDFTCYIVDFYKNYVKVEELRDYIQNSYLKIGYIGFSKLFDACFDFFGKHLFITNLKGEILSVSRLIHKTLNNLIPIEMGIVDATPKKRYVIEALDILDLNSFCFSNLRTANLLYACLADYCLKNGISKTYCLYDIKSKSFMRYYNKIGWEISTKYPDPIYFPGYGKMIDGKFTPTYWGILEMNLNTIQEKAKYLVEMELKI